MKPLHQPGDMIRDRYRILSILGQGGIGITYKAEDLIQGGNVAIKVLSLSHMTDWKALELFEREANVLKNLSHAAIPQYLNHFQIDLPGDRLFYLVQALAEGESLATLIEKGWPASEAEAKSIAVQVLKILNYLHWLTPPVIHRDIKPQNIIRRADGQVFLVDFGTVQSVYRNTLTVDTFVGTFGYMPPEQFRGQAFFASDLYGLGATLLFLLTHRSPADLPQQRMRILFRDRIQVSQSFADWLEKMLEPAIEDRFHSAEEALAVLRCRRQMLRSCPHLQLQASISSPTPIQKLKGLERSKIWVERSPNQLIIEIPPAGLSSMPGLQVLKGIIYPLMSIILILGMILTGAGVFALFTLPFGFTSLFIFGYLIFGIAASRRLEINARSFCISWSCFKFCGQQLGSTAALIRASVEKIPYPKHYRLSRSRLVLYEGTTQYFFGTEVYAEWSGIAIGKAEQEWLAAEISDFLAQLR
jgi:eukaryotic-like serine/threonine-protein kinase